MTPAIELEGVGKRYWHVRERAMLVSSLLPGRRPKKTERWALRNLDLKLDQGETLGVIGHNGSGKSTLLRLLAGVTRPTEGRARIAGRVAPLISVGVGFHHEMTGRENVLVNGMLLGLDRAEIMERFDEICEFAEVDDYIDTPVKFYSNGMYMRLGFSVAVNSDPDVLLLDEVLAVGDAAFQLKCFERMRRLQRDGTTIVFVSHSMNAIRMLCPRAIVINHGALMFDGPAEEAIAVHHELMPGTRVPSGDSAEAQGPVTILSRELRTADGPTHHPETGEPVRLRVRLRFNQSVDSPALTFSVASSEGLPCYSMQTRVDHDWRVFQAGEEVDVDVDFAARLGGGTYRLGLSVSDRRGSRLIMQDQVGIQMFVAPRLGASGLAELDATISALGQDLTRHESLLFTPRNGIRP